MLSQAHAFFLYLLLFESRKIPLGMDGLPIIFCCVGDRQTVRILIIFWVVDFLVIHRVVVWCLLLPPSVVDGGKGVATIPPLPIYRLEVRAGCGPLFFGFVSLFLI